MLFRSVAQGEQREGIGKVVALMTGKPEQKSGAPGGAPTLGGGAPKEPAD